PHGRPEGPGLRQPGHAAAFLVHGYHQREGVAGVPGHGLQLAHEVRHLLRAVHVPAEEDDVAHGEIPDHPFHVGGSGVAVEPDHEPLPHPAHRLAHPAGRQPPNRLRTASLTLLPSAGFPAASRAARAALMARPRSFGDEAPVSAIAASTAAATSASEASLGRYSFRTWISASSLRTSSGRLALRKWNTESSRCLTRPCSTLTVSASTSGAFF